ncbi:AAA family ATPase [Brevibacillus sp. HB2.2]|uniref:AAA family ATPase n=1 Tax=Brevibacillus sp. HB2.2 TaxID=2738846 RepID=UPI00156A8F23|nr:AAA family ATPase [Brevibacillus sp. HB2.2]NRS51444.1 AAA family ATPase [Brevibacillus sp. HB2.2]
METKKLHLPRLKSLELKHFSLYESKDHLIFLDFEKPAACIIGANGLGKSTLLNCINYGLTGIINSPRRKIRSVSEFYKSTKFVSEYFDGRINDIDRDFANVTVTFELNNCILSVSRNFFPDNSVVAFECQGATFSNYENAVVELMGLNSFDQFAFLQVKIMSFDEDRELLFWEPGILTPTLFLTLGISPETAAEADRLAIEVQKSNSRIRNLQFEINKLNKRIEALQNEFANKEEENTVDQEFTEAALKEKYESLLDGLQTAENAYLKTKAELDIITAQIAELTAQQHLTKNEYDKLYNSLFSSLDSVDLKNSPIISELLKGHCVICNTSDSEVWKSAEAYLQHHQCPLCHTNLTENQVDESSVVEKLKEVDEELAQINYGLTDRVTRSTRLRNELESLGNYIEHSKAEVMEIEQTSTFISLQSNKKEVVDDAVQKRILSLHSAILEVEVDKDKETAKKEKLREQVLELHSLLNKKYEEAQRIFLPKFKSLARAFTGLDVDITFTQETNDAKELLAFLLTLKDTGRTADHQLSESQKFFIDIALRMAIVDYIADGTSEGAMLIDTPEGSLDIAYEANAGEMFAEFVNRGHQLVITANLNSSGLVKTFAKQMGKEQFNLINMLTWANLSSVQRGRLSLFNIALKEIESAMISGDQK